MSPGRPEVEPVLRMLVNPNSTSRRPGSRQNHGVWVGLQAAGARLDRVRALQRDVATYRSNDEYDRKAITHVMACSSLFPGKLIRRGGG